MAIVRVHLTQCDGCGRPGPFDGRDWWATAVKARNAAKKAGWTRIPKWSDSHPNGADICPRCATIKEPSR